MTRSDETLFEPRVADWLEGDPHSAPDQALDVVLAAFPSINQRRAWRAWRWFSNVSPPLKLALAVAAIVVAVLGGAWLLRPQPDAPAVGVQPAPSASAGPSAIDTTGWTPFTSDRYGFTISHPSDWSETPADHDWTFEGDIDLESTAPDSFSTGGAREGLGIRVSVWAASVAPGTNVEDWIGTYCRAQNVDLCTERLNSLADVETKDHHSGVFQWGAKMDTQAYFLDGQTMYIVAIWRDEDDPSVQPYGGARRLLEAFISTMTLPAQPPQGSPAN